MDDDNTINKNDTNFSSEYIKDKRRELALELLKIVGVDDFTTNSSITYEILQNTDVLKKFKQVIPALKTVYKVSNVRCLNEKNWDKNKHPGVNLLRQIMKENGYKLHLINEFKGSNGEKKLYSTKYVLLPED
jgi:hypothetical protein